MNIGVPGKSVLLHLRGRLDGQTCTALQLQLSALEASRFNLWILDLAQIDFIDSSGIAALVAALKLASKRRCRLAICNLHPSVRLIFEITQLDQVMECLEAEELAAIAPAQLSLALLPQVKVAA